MRMSIVIRQWSRRKRRASCWPHPFLLAWAHATPGYTDLFARLSQTETSSFEELAKHVCIIFFSLFSCIILDTEFFTWNAFPLSLSSKKLLTSESPESIFGKSSSLITFHGNWDFRNFAQIIRISVHLSPSSGRLPIPHGCKLYQLSGTCQ